MPSRLRLVARLAALAAIGVTVAVGSASGSASRATQREPNTGAHAHGRGYTIATSRSPILSLHADGRRLVWETRNGVRIFDVVTHRGRSVRTSVPRRKVCYGNEYLAEVFAGGRFIFECDGGGLSDIHADIYTWALDDRRVRPLGSFEVGWDQYDPADFGDTYGNPARIAAGGGALAFYGIGADSERQDGLFRVAGRRAVKLPYEPTTLASIDVAGRFVATLDWVSRCSCDRTPVYSPDGTEIAWSQGGTIQLMRSDGTGQRLLSAAGSAATYPGLRWSPSGSTLAFEGKDGIYLVDRDGHNERRLVAGGSQPDWSPDGTKLALVRAAAGGSQLWTVNADGSGEQRLTSDVGFGSPDWSPDGTRIVVDVTHPPAYAPRIDVIDAASGAERDLGRGSGPVWSPDGTKIAFTDGFSLAAMNSDGSSVRVLDASQDWGDRDPAWSPDGTRVAFAAFGLQDYNEQEGAIAVVNPDGSGKKTLQGRYAPGAPAWSPNGQTIVAGDGEGGDGAGNKQGLWELDVAKGGGRHLVTEELTTAVEVRNNRTGKLLRRWEVPTESQFVHSGGWVSLSSRYLVAQFWHRDLGNVIARYDIATGRLLGMARWPKKAGQVSLAGGWGVYSLGRRSRLLNAATGRTSPIPTDAQLALASGRARAVWVEPLDQGSRVRELVLDG